MSTFAVLEFVNSVDILIIQIIWLLEIDGIHKIDNFHICQSGVDAHSTISSAVFIFFPKENTFQKGMRTINGRPKYQLRHPTGTFILVD